MIYGVAWADVAIGAVLVFGVLRGFQRGFIGELAGILALVAAAIVPWYYNGILDDPIATTMKIAVPFAHYIGMALSSIFAYIVVITVAGILGRARKIPVLGLGNSLGGAVVGAAKAAILVWLVLFIALYFPLTPAIRSSLRLSFLASYFTSYNGAIDTALEEPIPSFLFPLVKPIFARHHT